MTTGQQQPLSRAERARQAAEEEKRRIEAIARKSADEAGDVVITVGGGTASVPTDQGSTSSQTATVVEQSKTDTTPQVPPRIPEATQTNGVSADRPIADERKKVDRQGIDLRPEDRERVIRFEMFCLQNRLKTGKKRGLTLYARAGFQLLEQLVETDPAKAAEILRSLGDKR